MSAVTALRVDATVISLGFPMLIGPVYAVGAAINFARRSINLVSRRRQNSASTRAVAIAVIEIATQGLNDEVGATRPSLGCIRGP